MTGANREAWLSASSGDRQAGFSLVEMLVAIAITLVVMGLVAQTMHHAGRLFSVQSEIATTSSSATSALDDIAHELALAGQGLGDDVPSVVPESELSNGVTIRSNPDVAAGGFLEALEAPGEDVAFAGAEAFREGSLVLLIDARGRNEVAEVIRVSAASIALRSRETPDGTFRARFTPGSGARALGLREVRYFLREAEGDGVHELVKDVVGVGTRVLARDVLSLAFDYLDETGEPITAAKVEDGDELASVRIALRYLPGADALAPLSLATSVTLADPSGAVDFESRDASFRLSRIFYPIEGPTGVASRVGSDWGVILAAGADPQRDPAFVYSFPMEQQFLGGFVDDVAYFDDVRAPVTLAFGPETGTLSGSLFVAAWGLRIGHLTRMAPDRYGKLSEESEVTPFEGTEAIAQAGGMTFASDGALYVTSQEKGAIYRYPFDSQGEPAQPERLFGVPGTPGAIVEGSDGHLYFLMDVGGRGSLWRMAFDASLAPGEPAEVGALPGVGVSLALDPIDGSLFALVRTPIDDFVVVELNRGWIQTGMNADGMPREEPPVAFSLQEWQRKLEEGDVEPREIPFSPGELPQRMQALRTDELDFISFDAWGSLYLGAKDADVVLKFELPRPSGRYAVGVAAGVVERGGLPPEIRMHAWKKTTF